MSNNTDTRMKKLGYRLPENVPEPDQLVLVEYVSGGRVVIINSLTAEEYSGKVNRFPRAGRFAGSVNIDCELLVDPDTHTLLPEEQLHTLFNAVGALDGNSVITYCGGGVAASSNALALSLLGVQDVAVYDGGLIEWTADPELPMEVDIK